MEKQHREETRKGKRLLAKGKDTEVYSYEPGNAKNFWRGTRTETETKKDVPLQASGAWLY